MSLTFLLPLIFLTVISAQTSLFEGSSKSSLPYYSSVPLTNFRCENQQWAGYYSDPEADCQVFHICIRRHEKLEQFSFLCPNETVFHQQLLVCVWWDGFECSSASSLYYINENIFEDHGTGLDLEAHVALSQGKTLVPEKKIIPTLPTKQSVPIGKTLIPSVKPSLEGRSLDIDNKIISTVPGGYLNEITKKPEVKEQKKPIKPSKPTYLPQRTSTKRQDEIPLKTEEIINPDLQLLSEPHSNSLVSVNPSVDSNNKLLQTSNTPSVKVRVTEKPTSSYLPKSTVPFLETTLSNKRQKSKSTISVSKDNSSAKLDQSSVQTSRRSNNFKTNAEVTKNTYSSRGNPSHKQTFIQSTTSKPLNQKKTFEGSVKTPVSVVQPTASPKPILNTISLKKNEALLPTSKTLSKNIIPKQKNTKTKVIKNPFTVKSTVSVKPTSKFSPRENNDAISTPESFKDIKQAAPRPKPSTRKADTSRLTSTKATPLKSSRNLSTSNSPINKTGKQVQRKPLKNIAQKSTLAQPIRSRSKITPKKNLSRGLTTYDVLHDLLKNVTILRSKTLLKTKSDNRRRNVRQNISNYVEKPLVKPTSAKFASLAGEKTSLKQSVNKPKIKSYANSNKDIKSSNYNFGQKVNIKPKQSNSVRTLQSLPPETAKQQSTTSSFVPTLPPTEDFRKKTTKKGYLNTSTKNKKIQVKNFQDFLNLELPRKSTASSSSLSGSSLPTLSTNPNSGKQFSLIDSSIYETSSTPKNGLYK